MSNGTSFDGEHTAVFHCQQAARYFAMAWAASGGHWAESGREAFASAAAVLGYRLEKINTDNPQAEHEACLARRVAEDGPPPITSEPGFDGRDGGRMNPINSGAE